MTGVNRFKKLIQKHGGTITTSIVEGIYITPDVWEDRLLINQS